MMVKTDKIRSAVQQATGRGEGGVLDPLVTDPKTGLLVLEALATKHADLMVPDLDEENVKCFEHYD